MNFRDSIRIFSEFFQDSLQQFPSIIDQFLKQFQASRDAEFYKDFFFSRILFKDYYQHYNGSWKTKTKRTLYDADLVTKWPFSMRSRIIFEWRKLPRESELRCWAKRVTSPPMSDEEPEEPEETEHDMDNADDEEEEQEEEPVPEEEELHEVELDDDDDDDEEEEEEEEEEFLASVMLLRMDAELLTRKLM